MDKINEDQETDDENDPVVREIDVFLSQNMPGIRDPQGKTDGLFLFQYPLRPRWRPLEEGWHLEKLAYRPINQMVEMDLLCGEEGDEFRHKLVSSLVTPKSSYAVGLLRDDQLHLSPLCDILQFRPRFDAKDEEDLVKKKERGSSGKGMDDTMEDGSDAEDSSMLPAVQVRVVRRESDKAKEIRTSSHAYMKEQEDKEPWKEVQLSGPLTDDSKAVLENLISPSGRNIPFNTENAQYLASLNATTKSRDDTVPAQTADLSREQLALMALPDQVRALIAAAQALQFKRLVQLMPNGVQHADEIVKVLPEVATLVQGSWVVKSELLYPLDADRPPPAGASAAAEMRHAKHRDSVLSIQRCRDHILAHFHRNVRVHASALRKDITREVTPMQLESMLFQLAVRREGCWEFRLAPDGDFATLFASVQEAQDAQWKATEARLAALVGRVSASSRVPASAPAPEKPPAAKKGKAAAGAAAKAGGVAASADGEGEEVAAEGGAEVEGELGTQEKSQLTKFLTQTLKAEGVLSLEELLGKLADHPTQKLAAAATGKGLPEVEICIAGLTQTIGQSLILRSTAYPSATAPARDAMIQLMTEKGSCPKQEAVEYLANALPTPPSTFVVTKLLKELAYQSGTLWVFKGNPPPPPPPA